MIQFPRFRYWLPLLPLLAFLGFVYWLDQQVRRGGAAAADDKRHDPDVIMEDFRATKMDEQGVPRYFLNAQQLRHYPDNDSTEMNLPRLTLLNGEQPDVHMTASRGEISSKGDVVIMKDDVKVDRPAKGDMMAMSLRTQFLRVIPGKDMADTDQAVTIFNERNTVRGIGLEMDNNAHTLKLLSHVRSEHMPNAK